MADVVGFLREDATHGERAALKLLSRYLPEEFTVCVGSPIHAAERPILYMAISRAREKLYMTYFGKLRARMRTCAGRAWRILWDD